LLPICVSTDGLPSLETAPGADIEQAQDLMREAEQHCLLALVSRRSRAVH
jgi:hypothetical protein